MPKFRKYYLLKLLLGWCRAPPKIGKFFAVALARTIGSKSHPVRVLPF